MPSYFNFGREKSFTGDAEELKMLLQRAQEEVSCRAAAAAAAAAAFAPVCFATERQRFVTKFHLTSSAHFICCRTFHLTPRTS